MHIIGKTGMYFGSLLNILSGATAVFLGTYVFSRIKEKQEIESRLERIEQILQQLAEEKEKK